MHSPEGWPETPRAHLCICSDACISLRLTFRQQLKLAILQGSITWQQMHYLKTSLALFYPAPPPPPQAAISPSLTPQPLLNMLLHNLPDWTSFSWWRMFFLEKSLAPATLRLYCTGQRCYLAFCQDTNLQPLPVVEHTLCTFVAHLGRERLTHPTIKSYLSAIHHCHIMSGQRNLFIGSAFPVLQYVLRGIKWSPVRAPRQLRLPITPSILLLKA